MVGPPLSGIGGKRLEPFSARRLRPSAGDPPRGSLAADSAVCLLLLDVRERYSLQQVLSGIRGSVPLNQRLLAGLDELNFQGDGDFFADKETTGFKGRVPAEPKVFAIDLGSGRKANAGIAPWILARCAGPFDCEGNGFRDSMNGQDARNCILCVALLCHACG